MTEQDKNLLRLLLVLAVIAAVAGGVWWSVDRQMDHHSQTVEQLER